MTIERIPVAARSAEWLALRAQDLTASDVAAVCGLDPHKTAFRVYAEKTGLIPGAADNKMMRRGRWLESAAAEALKEERPNWQVKLAGVYFRDPDLRLGATPDAVAIDPERPGLGNIQIKVVSKPVYEANWQNGPPLGYQLQTLTEGMLMDAAWLAVAALVIDTYSADLFVHDVPRHAGAEAKVRDTARTFWRNVEAGQMPPPSYKADAETIEAVYATPERAVVDLNGSNRLPVLLAERAEAVAARKLLDDEINEMDAEIKAALGDAEEGLIDGWKVTWKMQHRKPYTVPAKSFRALRITDKREPAE